MVSESTRRSAISTLLARDIVPKFVEIRFSLGCEAMRHQWDLARSAAKRLRPRSSTSSASAFIDSAVISRPSSEFARDAGDERLGERCSGREHRLPAGLR